MQPISLDEMQAVRLMNRIDSKFVTTVDNIRLLLEAMEHTHRIQEIDGMHNMPYSTTYYDTPSADMYYQHHRGKKTRQKVRTRIYEGSMTVPFLEIKHKNNKGRTKKKRVLMEENTDINGYASFLQENSYYEAEGLEPRIRNHFYRITLVNNELTERITIDTGLEFHNLKTGITRELGNIGIIEWKRDGRASGSTFGKLLRTLRIRQGSFSKYVIGMALTDPSLPQGRLKPRLRHYNKFLPQTDQHQEPGIVGDVPFVVNPSS